MKILAVTVFLTMTLFGTQIDTRLYEGGDTLAYYDQLVKNLQTT